MKLNATLIATFALLLALPGSALAAPKAKMRFSSSVVVVSEASGSATVTVTRQPRNGKSKSTLNNAVSVNYSTSAGTAGAADYTDVSGTLSFAPGETTKAFAVPIAQDSALENVETVNLRLSAPSRNAVVVNPSSATLSIADDDGPTQLQFSSPTYSVSEFGPTAELTVVRNGDSTGASTVAYATANGTAGSSDYGATNGTLSFAAGDVSKTISVAINNDSDIEGTETFGVNLTNATGAVFANGNAAGPVSATVSVIDDDTLSGQAELAFDAASYQDAENAGGIAVTVVRSGRVDRIVSATIRSSDGSALAGVDYEALDDLVEFEDGDLTQTLVLPLVNDSDDENDETFSLALSAPTGGLLGAQTSSTLTILDDDQTTVVETPSEQPAAGGQVVLGSRQTGTTPTQSVADPFAGQSGLLILGSRLGSCKLSIATFKRQRLLKSKSVRVKLHALEACTGNVKSHVKGRKSLRGVKKGAVQTKVVKFSLQAGQTKTITMRFTKRGFSFLKRALGKQKTLSASLLVRSINASKRSTLDTLRWTAKR